MIFVYRIHLFLSTVALQVVGALEIISDASSVVDKVFDYVIVGGGTAGLTVASRLAEIPNFSVLVIEAGPNAQNDSAVNDPAQSGTAADKYNWGYVTTPQSFGNLSLGFLQGKVLGGSSSVNGMVWNRATISQYNSLEELGNPGWNWDDLLAHMKNAEHFHLPNADQVCHGATVLPQFHGFEGAIDAGYPQPYAGTESFSLLRDVFQTVIPGLAKNPDDSSGNPGGIFRWFFSIKPAPDSDNTPDENTRSSAADGYIYPFINNPSQKKGLTILVDHLASRILWDTSSTSSPNMSTATAVEFIAVSPACNDAGSRETFTVKVKKEVIVACGGLGSPHFLELSGIGNPSILRSAGIPTQVNLPSIGTNLQDQAQSLIFYEVSPSVPPESLASGFIGAAYPNITQLYPKTSQEMGQELIDSIEERAKAIVQSGAFTSLSGLEKIFTIQAKDIVASQSPILELSYATSPPIAASGGVSVAGATVWGLLPQWRGTVHATSCDPAVLPELNPNYLTTPFDVSIQVAAMKLVRQLFATSPLSTFALTEIILGFAAVPQNATDAGWAAFLQTAYLPTTHPIGTVSMLPREDGGAVDSELRVYGTTNVRVVDASILPIQLSAHLSGTVYGIAEKAAEIIKSSMV